MYTVNGKPQKCHSESVPKTKEQRRNKTANVAAEAAPRRASYCLEADSQLGLDSSCIFQACPISGRGIVGPARKGRGGQRGSRR